MAGMTTGVTLHALGVWMLTGVLFGLVGSLYGAARSVYRIRGWVGHGMDGMLAALAGAVTFLVLVGTDWGVLRIWTVVAILAGYLFWAATAGTSVYALGRRMMAFQARFVKAGLKSAGRVGHAATGTIRWVARTVRRSQPK